MMSSCLSASRGYKARLGNNSCVKGLSSSQTTATTTSTVISDTKSNLSSSETTSSLLVLRKKRRTRRRRPQEIYNEAAAALSAVYPKVFCPPKEKLALRKKSEPLSSENDEELLHEVPTLIRKAGGMEEIDLLYNEGGGGVGDSEFGDSHSQVPNLPMAKDSPASSESKSQVMSPCNSPSADDFESSEIDYDYSFLDSNEESLDASVMSSIMGCSPNPDFQEENFCCYGIHQYHQELEDDRLQYSAIRSLRRNQDFMVAPAFDYSFPRFRFSERAKERNGLSSSSSLGWLKGEDAPQRLKLRLNYDDVLNAWSDKGPAYTDDIPHSQIGLVDSSLGSMVAGFNYDFIPDLSFWRGLDENGMYGQMEDRYVFGEDGLFVSSGVREASVLRYKEKRRTRLFSKKIRYEVRKLNAERRPRMKGRFVRRLSDL